MPFHEGGNEIKSCPFTSWGAAACCYDGSCRALAARRRVQLIIHLDLIRTARLIFTKMFLLDAATGMQRGLFRFRRRIRTFSWLSANGVERCIRQHWLELARKGERETVSVLLHLQGPMFPLVWKPDFKFQNKILSFSTSYLNGLELKSLWSL